MRRVLWAAIAIGLLSFNVQAEKVRVGEDVPHLVETLHPYEGPGDAAAAQRIRTEILRYPSATYIAVHFARFELADGDFLVVRSPDGGQSWRYEGLGRAGLGLSPDGFWATHIKGDTAVVELFSRSAEPGAYGFSIDRYARGYTYAELEEKGIVDPDDLEAICGSDDAEWAKCYQNSEPEVYEEARAVARLLISGSFTCTGWLVGCEGHLMTNNHCIGSAGQALNTDYEFMAEGASCGSGCFGSLACPGNIEATSGTLVQTNAPLDYSLVQLPNNVTDTYGYMQLRDTGAVLNERIYIPQHPAGWGKRIGVFSTHTQDQSGFCEVFSLNANPCTGGPGDIGYYCDTQGGSSGSPVLAYSDHRVVSLHHCANCPNRGLDILDVIGSLGSSLPACAIEQLAGEVGLDAESYTSDDTVTITVEDDSLQGLTSQPVTISSDTEPVPETVTLSPDSPGSGTFVGIISLTHEGAEGGDGLLSVGDGDTIMAVYIDEDDGQGGINVPRQDTATIDAAAPLISGVEVTNLDVSSATITWQTNEPADSRVSYGTSPPGSDNVADGQLVMFHAVNIESLLQCTEHFFSVASADAVGNIASDDNGGNFYSFETICIPPPAIPDGSGASQPITAQRKNAQGTKISVFWDNSCSPAKTKIIHGPLDQVSTYEIDGSVCGIPAFVDPKVWSNVPAGDLWFLMVADDGFGTESSWGEGTGGERNGADASDECNSTVKDLTATCE